MSIVRYVARTVKYGLPHLYIIRARIVPLINISLGRVVDALPPVPAGLACQTRTLAYNITLFDVTFVFFFPLTETNIVR